MKYDNIDYWEPETILKGDNNHIRLAIVLSSLPPHYGREILEIDIDVTGASSNTIRKRLPSYVILAIP